MRPGGGVCKSYLHGFTTHTHTHFLPATGKMLAYTSALSPPILHTSIWNSRISSVVAVTSLKKLSAIRRIRCISEPSRLRTCKNCKTQFDPLHNDPRTCRYHTAHFGGETKRKFESVYTGGTMDTSDSGKVFQYWHCCGAEDPFDPGCTAGPHASYDDL
ncbi:uncharacterized protein LOC124930918 [Impatiens glandulifera]|uniref:uncharacterized protein LOC124930918 n=1 Tax=Impatiens glandulifera TaxID=253017 RepID=UPI001FB115E1|nr:uncharacterized protein LOC124930918 [Impatiens glandulifera]